MRTRKHSSISRTDMAEKLRTYRTSEDAYYTVSTTGSRTLSIERDGNYRHYYTERKAS